MRGTCGESVSPSPRMIKISRFSRNEDTRVWRFLVTVSKVPQHLIGVIGLDDEDRAVTRGEDGASIRDEDLFTADECADEAFLRETRFHE